MNYADIEKEMRRNNTINSAINVFFCFVKLWMSLKVKFIVDVCWCQKVSLGSDVDVVELGDYVVVVELSGYFFVWC